MNSDFIKKRNTSGTVTAGVPAEYGDSNRQISLTTEQDQSSKSYDPQCKKNNHNRTEDVQFGLEFVIDGRNSVEQMIDGASLMFDNACCHGTIFKQTTCHWFSPRRNSGSHA
jgi:hypothetical protein